MGIVLPLKPLRLVWNVERNVPVPILFDDFGGILSIRGGSVHDPDAGIQGATHGIGVSTPRSWRMWAGFDRATFPHHPLTGGETKYTWPVPTTAERAAYRVPVPAGSRSTTSGDSPASTRGSAARRQTG